MHGFPPGKPGGLQRLREVLGTTVIFAVGISPLAVGFVERPTGNTVALTDFATLIENIAEPVLARAVSLGRLAHSTGLVRQAVAVCVKRPYAVDQPVKDCAPFFPQQQVPEFFLVEFSRPNAIGRGQPLDDRRA